MGGGAIVLPAPPRGLSRLLLEEAESVAAAAQAPPKLFH